MHYGRLHAPDQRDAQFPMRAAIPRALPERTVYRQPPRHRWDQGATGTCVGHAWRAWSEAGPVMARSTDPPGPIDVYKAAILIDEWTENDNDAALQFGTSVRAGAKVMRDLGRLSSFVWAHSTGDVVQFLLTHGPVVLGTDWFDSMGTPDADGIVRIPGDARVVGGHAYLCYGYNVSREVFRCQNSWGPRWGDGGRFWITREDLERLLRNQGEACGAAELPRARGG